MALTSADKKYIADLLKENLTSIKDDMATLKQGQVDIRENMVTKADMKWIAEKITDGMRENFDRYDAKYKELEERVSDIENELQELKRHVST